MVKTVGIDIRFLAKGSRTGIEEYAINLLSRLLPLGRDIKFKLFYNAFLKVGLEYDWLNLPNVELRAFRLPNRFLFDPLAKFFCWPRLDKMLGGVDVFFGPHFLLSPLSRNCRRVTTFHDLSFEYFPEFFSGRKRFWHGFLSPRARAREADKIIAVSQSTKDDLMGLYGVPEEKIKVIHSGVGGDLRPLTVSVERVVTMRRKYGLPEKFILYFGTLEPRKNLVGLIKAYEIFCRQAGNGGVCGLVLAGNQGWLCRDILSLAAKSPYADSIILAGFVEPADKIYLYNLASLFVYPSFFEGFGFPPLEAMACGAPVICSHTSSFPETVGGAGLMVDPYNYGEIAWAMTEVSRDEELRKNLVQSGLERVRRFSWDKTAAETLNFLTE